MADSPELRYVINTTLGKLDGLKTIQTQIIALQKLAAEGADFGIRINPTALNGIRQTVASAVADGVALGGGKGGQAFNTGGGSGSAVGELGAVLMELRKAASALSSLAQTRRARDVSPEQRESNYTSNTHGVVNSLQAKRDEIKDIMGQARKIKDDSEPEKIVQQVLDVVKTGLPHFKKESQREISREFEALQKTFENALNPREQDNAAFAMQNWLKQFLSALSERDRRVKEILGQAHKHYDAGALNDEFRTAPSRSGSGSNTGRVSGAGAFAIDQSALNAAFVSAADAFGQRLMAYLPGGGGGGYTHSGAVAPIGSAQPGMIFSQGSGALPRKVCSRCGGSGSVNIGNGKTNTCYKCGGSGDENHPNVAAAVAAGADASKVGNFASNPVTGTANNPIIPHSVGRREEIIKEMMTLESRRRDPIYSTLIGNKRDEHGNPIPGERLPNVQEQLNIDDRMHQLNEEFSAGGVRRTQFHGNPRVQNDLLVSQAELAQMATDPTFKPTQATGTGKFNLGDPMLQTAEHINLLTGAIEGLNKVNLNKVGDTFTKLSSDLGRLAADMNGVSAAANKVVGQDMELNYTKLLNAEKERHVGTINNMKSELREQRESERVIRTANRMLQADKLSKMASGIEMPVGAFDKDRLERSIDRRFRRLGRISNRADDLSYEANALTISGLPGGTNAGARVQNAAAFMGTRAGLLAELQRAAKANPKQYGYLLEGQNNVNNVVAGQERYNQMTAALRTLQESRGAQGALKKRFGNAIPAEALKLAQQAESASIGTLTHLGIIETGRPLPAGPARDMAIAQMEGAKKTISRLTHKDSSGNLIDPTDPMKKAAVDQARATFAHFDSVLSPRGENPAELSVSKLKERVAAEGSVLEQQTQALVKLAGARHEERKALMAQGEGWDRFTRKFRDLVTYMAAGTMIYSSINLMQRAVKDAAAFESDMADIQGIFVAKTSAQRDAVMGGIMKGAVDFGVSRSAAAGTAKTFAQTGLNPERTVEMMRASLLAQRGAGLDAGQATEMLIAVDNLTKGAVHPTDMIDRISRVEARHAVTAQDLSAIIQRAGPMATQLQPDMLGSSDALDMLMGMGTSLIEKTRVSGSNAGTTLKFLMARLSAPGVQKKLQDNFGVMLGERNSGEMRQMTDIFGDIAGKYEEFKTTGQTGKAASLLTTFAGARQANAAAAIFDDWKKTMDVAQESSMAFGDSQRRLSIQMDTLNSKAAQASSAFSNFTTTFLQSSGLMDAMKFVLTGAAKGMQVGAEHPIASSLIQAGGLFGVGKLLELAGPGLAQQWGMLGIIGKMAPVLGAMAQVGGVVAAGAGAYALTDHLVNGDERERRRQTELYGPETFDRSTYDESDQGKNYSNTAKKYGLTSLGLYSALAQASSAAHAAAVDKFGEAGANSTHNPKLARFMEEEMVRQLNKMLPGFKDIADESEKTATALQMLRQSMQYGGVGNFVQQGGFQEKKQAALQDLQENMLKDPTTMIEGALGGHYGLRLRTSSFQGEGGEEASGFGRNGEQLPNKKWKYVDYKDIGMAYNTSIATMLGHDTSGMMMQDNKNILNSMQPQLGIGYALGATHLTTGGTILSQAVALEQTGKSLGQALDALADNIENLNDKDKEALKIAKEKGTLTAKDRSLLDKQTNFDSLVQSMGTALNVGLDVQGRTDAANAAAPRVGGLVTGGGKMIDRIIEAARIASEVQMKKLDPQSDAYKDLERFHNADLAPGNRDKTRLDVLGALSGVNLRQYLKDKVMDEFLRLGERQGVIGLSSQYLSGTGIAYDPAAERAAASTQALQGFIQVSSQLPMDQIRAAHRAEMAAGAGDFSSVLTDEGDLTDQGRSALSRTMALVMKKNLAAGKTGENKQLDQLGIQLQAVKRAGLEWKTGAPNEMFDHLAPKYQQTLANIMKLNSMDELMGFGTTQQDAVLALFKAMATTDIGLHTQKQIGNIKLGGLDQRRGINLQTQYALSTAGISHDLAVEMAKGDDQAAIMDLHKQMVEAGRVTNVGMANSQYQTSMNDILNRAGQTGGFAQDGTLTGTFATEAANVGETLQSAVVQANADAQRNLLELLNDAHVDFVKNAEQHYDQMQHGFTEPIVKVLSDPRSLLGSKKGGELVTAIGGFANQKLAESAMDNLFGSEGVFGEKFGNMFKNPIFEGAHLIRQAHIDGMQTGARMIAGMYGLGVVGAAGAAGAAGLPSGGRAAAGSFMASGARAAGAGISALLRLGSGRLAGSTTRVGVTDSESIAAAKNEALNGAMANVIGNPNMGVHVNENGNGVIIGAMGGSAAIKNGKKQLTQNQIAAYQIATLATVYASSAIFGKTDKASGLPTNYGVEGTQFGSMIGGMIPQLGPLGPIIGAAVGGLVGSLFHRKVPVQTPEYDALTKIERNTREAVDAISNQTRNLLSPENRLLYSPSTFSMPQMQPFGGSSSSDAASGQANITVEVNLNAGDRSAADLAAEIAGHIQTQLSTLGTFTDPRF